MQRQTITASEARARVLLENAASWARGTATTTTGETIGVVLFASGSRPGVVYMTRCDGAAGACTCPAAQRGFRECCHVRAVRMEAEAARAAVGPRRATYAELMAAQGLVDAF